MILRGLIYCFFSILVQLFLSFEKHDRFHDRKLQFIFQSSQRFKKLTYCSKFFKIGQFYQKKFSIIILAKICALQAKFGKNRPKKAFLGTFWKILSEKLYILAPKAPLEKF